MAEEIGALRAVLALESAAFDKGVASARRQLTGLEGGFQKTGGQVVQFGQRMSRDATAGFNSLNRSAGASRAGLQNFGYQVQDVAVQIAGGTSATRALSQQLPQLLSGFGLLGIAAGTAAAVLIPLAGYLFNTGEQAKTADQALKGLASAADVYVSAVRNAQVPTKELITTYGQLSVAARDALAAMADVALINAMRETDAAIAAVVGSLSALEQRVVVSDDGFSRTVETIRVLNDNFGLSNEQVDALRNALSSLDDAQGLLAQADAARQVGDALIGAYGSAEALPDPLREAYAQMQQIVLSAGEVQGAVDGIRTPLGFVVDLAGQVQAAASGLAGYFSAADGAAGGLAQTLAVAAQNAWALAQARVAAAQIAVDQGMVYSGRGGDPRQFMAGESGSFNRDFFQVPKIVGGGGGGRARSGGGGGMSETAREAARVFAETRTEAEKYAIEVDKLNKLLAAGGISQDTFNRAMDGMKEKTDELAKAADRINESFEGAFADIVTGAKSLEEGLSGVLQNLADMMAQSAALKLNTALFGSAGVGGKLAGVLGFADGGALNGGRVQAFAAGGIVNGPTVFPMANGAGLMGEAGPEAIMPLTRIGGKLGVRAAGGGGSVVNIDARYATEGTAEMIVRAIQRAAPGIVKQSVSANRAAGARGY
jgi:hypothetical protein